MTTVDNRQRFAAALREQLGDKPASWLAREIGVSSQAAWRWVGGDAAPAPENVFAMEKLFGLRAGALARLLGYLPVTAVAAVDVEYAIDSDSRLSGEERSALKALVRHFLADGVKGR